MDNSGRMSKVDSKSDKKASHGLSDTFPIGLRVLVVEDEQTWLKMLEKMLQKCLYKVTVCSSAVDALSLLRERKHEFDLVTSNVHLPGMDGFKLLEHIRRETDLPVIIISADDDKDAIMKGVISGACDYMIKPVGIETLKNIWQHVVRKRRNEMKELEHSGSVGESDRPQKPSDDTDYASSAIECSFKNIKRRKEEEDEMEERINETSTMKKQRVVWSAELHQQFTAAVNQLGIDKAVPKKLLELMNVPGLTRENVASHLQKYRHRNLGTGVSLPQSILNIPSMGQPEEYLGLMLPRDRLEIQASSVSDELSLQSYAPPQAGGIETSSDKTGMMIIPYIDQVNTSGSEISNLRFGVGQLQLGNNIKQENFFHSHPTTMEPNQLAPWHEPVHSFGNMDLQVAENALSIMKLSLLTGSTCHTGIAPGNQGMSLMSQMIQSHSGHLSSLGQNGTVLNGRGAAYGPVSQASVVDFPMNLVTELPGNGIPLCITAGISTPEPTRMLQAARSLENKGFRSFSQRCDVFNEIQQNIPQDWELQNADQNDNEIPLNISQSFFGNQGFFSSQKTGQNSNTSIAGKEVVTGREENENGNPESMVKFQNNLLDNSLRVKAKSMHNLTGDQNMHLTDHLDENKLLIGQFLKLHQEEVETNFNFDGTPRENVQMWKSILCWFSQESSNKSLFHIKDYMVKRSRNVQERSSQDYAGMIWKVVWSVVFACYSGGALTVGLPPAWVDVSEEISTNMQRARSKMAELVKARAKALMPSFGDGKEDQHLIEALTQERTDLLKRSEKRLQKLSASGRSEDSNVRKNVQRSIATDLQNLSFELRKKQSTYLKRLRQQKEGQDGVDLKMNLNESTSKVEDDDFGDMGFNQHQMSRLKKNEAFTAQRERKINQVVESVNELAQIMKDLSVLVIDQGTIVDRIDYNIQNVAASVEQGHKQLQQAERTKRKGGMVMCATVLVIMCFIMLVLLILKQIIL